MRGTGRLQFSIRMMLVATGVVAAAVGAVTAQPSWRSLIALECLTLLLATASVIALRQAAGNWRTFWMGATMAHAMAFICAGHVIPWFVPYQHGLDVAEIKDYAAGAAQSLRYILPVIWCAAPLNGVLAVFLQRLFAPRQTPHA